MNRNEEIKSILDNSGLTFETHEDFFSTIWKINPSKKIQVIITSAVVDDWVHVLCQIGSVKDFEDIDFGMLLRLNNALVGVKISLDAEMNIICSSEIMYSTISETSLKFQITQVVKLVALFYDDIEKQNLKLDSA